MLVISAQSPVNVLGTWKTLSATFRASAIASKLRATNLSSPRLLHLTDNLNLDGLTHGDPHVFWYIDLEIRNFDRKTGF